MIKVIAILAFLSIVIACIDKKYIDDSYTELTIIFLLVPSIIVDVFLSSNGIEILTLFLPIWIIHIELAIIYEFLCKIYDSYKMSKLSKISKNQKEIKMLINNINKSKDEYTKLVQKEE